jgi:hypothetical protein
VTARALPIANNSAGRKASNRRRHRQAKHGLPGQKTTPSVACVCVRAHIGVQILMGQESL